MRWRPGWHPRLNPKAGAPIPTAIISWDQGLLAERGHWDNAGRGKLRVNALARDEIRDVCRFDPDFVICYVLEKRCVFYSV